MIRRTSNVVAGWVFFVLVISFILWLSGPLSPYGSLAAKLAFGLGLTTALWWAWKFGGRCGVILDSRGITVVEMFTTDHVSWAALREVEVDKSLYLRLTDGRTLTPTILVGTTPDSLAGHKFQHRIAAEIRDRAVRAGAHGPVHTSTHRGWNLTPLIIALVSVAALTILSHLL